MFRRLIEYAMGACFAIVLVTAVAHTPPKITEVAQQADFQPTQVQLNITPLPAASVAPLVVANTKTSALAPQITPFTFSSMSAREHMPSGVTQTLTLSATLPITATSTPTVAPEDAPLNIVELGGHGPVMRGQLVVRTEQLDFYLGKSSLSVEQIEQLAPQVEQALHLAENRFGEQLYQRVSLGYYFPKQRNIRGLAYTERRIAELYYRSDESLHRAIAPAVHELAHHLQYQRYGRAIQTRADTILLEGAATWIAGDSWLPMCGATTWRERARQLRDAGVPLELTRAERHGANNAYELWASFVDFFLDSYGSQTYRELYTSSRGRAHGSADYQGVTGKSLDELTAEWRAWIDQ